MINKILKSTIILSMLSTTVANADFLGLEVGYAAWSSKLTGNIQKGDDAIDFEDDLGYGSSKTNAFMWAYFDHPIPLIPNVKIQQTNYNDSAIGKIRYPMTFAGYSIGTINESVSSEFTFNQTDIIPYWRILDNWINFDIGLNIKTINGNIKIDTAITNQHIDESFKVTLPMLYAKAKLDLPFSGLSFEADCSYVSYSGNKIVDLKGGIVYETSSGLGAIAGIKKQSFVFDDIDDTDGDINIEGIYLGIYFHF